MDKILTRLASSRLIIRLLTWAGMIHFPFIKIFIQVKGYKMASHTLDRFIALLLWRFGLLESYEHKLLRYFCRPGMKAIDIGANIGFHTLLMSGCVGETGKVWAFEPDPDNFRTLQLNLSQNGCANVTLVQAAASSKTEQINLFCSSAHHGDHRIYPTDEENRRSLPIQAYALDDYFDRKQEINLIKMDVQGAEGLVLSGMDKLLQSNLGLVMLFEFWPDMMEKTGCSPEVVLNALMNKGFEIFATNEKLARLDEIIDPKAFIQSMALGEYRNLVLSRDLQMVSAH